MSGYTKLSSVKIRPQSIEYNNITMYERLMLFYSNGGDMEMYIGTKMTPYKVAHKNIFRLYSRLK